MVEKIPDLQNTPEKNTSPTDPIQKSETETKLPDSGIDLEIPFVEPEIKTNEEIERDRKMIEKSQEVVDRDEYIKRKKEDIERQKKELETSSLHSSLDAASLKADELLLKEQEKIRKQDDLKRFLNKEQDLRDAILDIEERKRRKEDVSDMGEKEKREEYSGIIKSIKELANDIAGKDIGAEAQKKAEENYNTRNKRRGETVEEMSQRLVEEKAEDLDYQNKCIARTIAKSNLSEEDKKSLLQGREVKFGKNIFNRDEVAGLLSSGLNREGIEKIKWPVWDAFFKIKIDGRPFSKEELEGYIKDNLQKNFKEQAAKDIEAEKRKTANIFAYRMYQEVAGEGAIKEKQRQAPEKKEKKIEVSQLSRETINAKLAEEIKSVSEEFYNKYIKRGEVKLKRGGRAHDIEDKMPDEKKADFIMKNLDKINTDKKPAAAKIKEEIKGLIALQSALAEENPSKEAYYLAFSFIYKLTEELSYFKETPEQEQDWKNCSDATRELANVLAGKNLAEESKDELIKFLRKPEIIQQFQKEQKEELKNIAGKEEREFSKRRFKNLFEKRALKTLEENKIKELYDKKKAKEILGEDFSVKKALKDISDRISKKELPEFLGREDVIRNFEKELEEKLNGGFKDQKEMEEYDSDIFMFKYDFEKGLAYYFGQGKIVEGKEVAGAKNQKQGMGYQDFSGGNMKKEFITNNQETLVDNFDLKGRAIITLEPIRLNNKRSLFEKLLGQGEYYKIASVKDFDETEFDSEKIMEFHIRYCLDNDKYKDKRPIFCSLSFIIRESLADSFFRTIKENPENLWMFLNSINPEFLEAMPPAEASYYGRTELVVYKNKEGRKDDDMEEIQKRVEIIPWNQKKKN